MASVVWAEMKLSQLEWLFSLTDLKQENKAKFMSEIEILLSGISIRARPE